MCVPALHLAASPQNDGLPGPLNLYFWRNLKMGDYPSRRMERETGLSDAPVDHLVRQTHYESELINTSLSHFIII
jgi:hypothetical protein